ncbi:hypothetical protein ACQKP0_20835 [Heyndrickxia sp. NPDC080065]|uniref:hypothetical protein n=1 Tax=Heyndrickxia sp. NPDC080065 TaxID=3390568 RepID=UPI003CFBE0F9
MQKDLEYTEEAWKEIQNTAATDAINQIKTLQLEVNKLKLEKLQLQEQLLQAYKNELHLLHLHKVLLSKYNALRKSKLGKLTLFYWKKKRRIFGGK